MPIRIENLADIRFQLPERTPFVAMMHLHPSMYSKLVEGDILLVEHTESNLITPVPIKTYRDSFGNLCSRFVVPAGEVRLSTRSVVLASDEADVQACDAGQYPIEDLPADTLQYLLPSRYCEVDRLGKIAGDLFGSTKAGWERAAAIRDWAHDRIRFDYQKARSTKTAMEAMEEQEGVCRDFQHLAVTLSRCMNIPARYVTGYLGDIRVPFAGAGDFSAWYQVYLGGRWWNMDARHNHPRLGRVLMAVGRDAADVAITTSFGVAELKKFYIESNEIDAQGKPIPLPEKAAQAA